MKRTTLWALPMIAAFVVASSVHGQTQNATFSPMRDPVLVPITQPQGGAGQLLHGVAIAKGCVAPLCAGETTRCDIQIGYNDDLGDTLEVLQAWDIMDVEGDQVRIPPVGNLPIIQIGGNTTCVVGGGLPCRIGPGGSVLSGLPGDPQPGFVRFRQNTYVIKPTDPNPLLDQASIEWIDLCDAPGTIGCGVGILNVAPAPASTPITTCEDGNECTVDVCTMGQCSFEPDCTIDDDCDDGNACTEDVCTLDGCCENRPITCDDNDACTIDSCDPAVGCVTTPVDCDDGNVCTTDDCDPQTGCFSTPDCTSPADCNDDDACTEDFCTPEGCCDTRPVTCDDGSVCTEDSCDSVLGCQFEEIVCNDNNVCTTDACDDGTGCFAVPECTVNADCDDGNLCTNDFCTPEGCCDTSPVVCSDGDDCTDNDRCVGNGTCIGTPIPGCGSVPTVSTWGLAALALALLAAARIHFRSRRPMCG